VESGLYNYEKALCHIRPHNGATGPTPERHSVLMTIDSGGKSVYSTRRLRPEMRTVGGNSY